MATPAFLNSLLPLTHKHWEKPQTQKKKQKKTQNKCATMYEMKQTTKKKKPLAISTSKYCSINQKKKWKEKHFIYTVSKKSVATVMLWN